ncbi:MAG: hypothetical protein ACRC9K_21835 [Afipia sp.]
MSDRFEIDFEADKGWIASLALAMTLLMHRSKRSQARRASFNV